MVLSLNHLYILSPTDTGRAGGYTMPFVGITIAGLASTSIHHEKGLVMICQRSGQVHEQPTSTGAARYVALAVTLAAAACGTSSVTFTVTRPAEINLKEYRKIAIGDITNQYGVKGRHANDLADEITAVLLASGLFEVLNRDNLARIMSEYTLSETGIIDETSAVEIGQVIGTAALIFGRIQTDQYQEDLEKGKPYKDKEGRSHQTHTRKGTYRLTASLQVVDIQTAKVLAARSLSAEKSARKSADMKDPEKIDSNALYAQCVRNISQQFRRMVAPYDVQVRAAFLTDELLPETDQAISYFRIGEWDDGMAFLEAATRKSGIEAEVQSKAFYNLGLAQIYAGEYDPAIEHLKKALSLNPRSKRIQKTILRAKMEKENAAKLQEQL